MYSESDARKTRTLSICLIMLASSLVPLAAPVAATTPEMPDSVILEINNNGTWEIMPEFTDPFTDGLMEEGTYEFRLTSMHLTTNDSYELEWVVDVCSWGEDCEEPIEEMRAWTAMSDNSSETWNLTLDAMDCDVSVDAHLMNVSSGDSHWRNWNFFGPCGNTGVLTLMGDFDDDGSIDTIEGFDFDAEIVLAAGNYDASWGVDSDSLSTSGHYHLHWMMQNDEEMEGPSEWMAEWNGTDPGSLLDFDFDVLPWTCFFGFEAVLGQENSTSGDIDNIGAFYAQMSGPCDSPIEVSIWNETSEDWDEISGNSPQAGPYQDCYWSDDETRWWCGVDYDDDGELDETDTWWYYCEGYDEMWFCTDAFGQSDDHEFTENSTLLMPLMLAAGTYDIRVNLTYLNDSTHYGIELENLYPEYQEFNATSDNYSVIAQLSISPWDCESGFGVAIYEDPASNNPPMMRNWWQFLGPCEEMSSPFTLTYDGIEWEMEYDMMAFDDCTEMDGGWECSIDYDGDGYPDDYYWFESDQCEWIESDQVWHCEMDWGWDPSIEEGNHTMELLVEGLEIGEEYSIKIDAEVCSQVNCNQEWIEYNFTASTENETITFHMQTDNYTCSADVSAKLEMINENGGSWHIYQERFGFNGPCEEAPSPFSLTYDGIEWEMEYDMMAFDDCTEMDGGWECSIDYDGDGYPDDYYWFESDQCEWIESDQVWHCEMGWGVMPHIEDGNHTMELLVEDLEIGTEYEVKIDMHMHNQWFGTAVPTEFSVFNATGGNETITFHMQTDNFTCGASVEATLFEIDEGTSRFMGQSRFGFSGPCEQMPAPITLTYDGIEWEMEYAMMAFDDCTEMDGGWECSIDYDGDGYPDDYYWFESDQCEWIESDQVWHCEMGWGMIPRIEEGNHTMELLFDYLVIGDDYEVSVNTDVCYSMIGCDNDMLVEEFTASAENEAVTFHMETDNYTCHVNLYVNLYSYHDDGWRNHVFSQSFSFTGPCENPPSNIGLLYEDETGDMVEWMPDSDSMAFDDCTEMDGGWECSIDYDGDGYPDDYYWFESDQCEWIESDQVWHCEMDEGRMPSISNGTFPMTWNVSELDDGTDYLLSWDVMSYSHTDWNQTEGSAEFTGSSMGYHHIDWEMYVDSSYCGIDIQASLYETMDYHGDGQYDEIELIDVNHFGFQPECEMPTGPEMSLNIDVNGTWVEIEGLDMWNIMDIESSGEEPSLAELVTYTIEDAGNNQMAWTLGDLEIEDHYELSWNYVSVDMDGSQSDDSETIDFWASQEEEIVEWELDVSDSTCIVAIMGNAFNHENGYSTMMYFYIAGPESLVDDDGDGESDCIAMLESDNGGGPDEIPLGSENGHLELGMEDTSGDMRFIFPFEQMPEGSYEMMIVLNDLEEDCEDCYNIEMEIDSMGMEKMEMDGMVSTNDDGESFVDFILEINPWDCMMFIDISLYAGDSDEDWLDGYMMIIEGPCEGGSTEGLIDVALEDVDGNEHSLEEWIESGDYSMNIELSGLSAGDEYTILWTHFESVYGARDVIDRFWNSEEDPFMSHLFTADSDVEQVTMELMVHESCSNLLIVELYPGDLEGEDGDGYPMDSLYYFYETDCGDDHHDGFFDLMYFETSQEFSATLVMVDTSGVIVGLSLDTMLDEEIRMAIDFEIGDGDGFLDETEAMDFEEKFFHHMGGDENDQSECGDDGPPFILNGEFPECAYEYRGFANLESDSEGSPIFFQAWDMYWNVSADEDGHLTLNYPGDPPDSEGVNVNSTLCGGVLDGTMMEVVSWTYNGTSHSECVEVLAGDTIQPFEIVFGPVATDSDGDGVNDYDDRFPDDPDEWSDEDDDGWGDNSDAFPNDPDEWNDYDGDGVGDNGDAFPWDSSESLDSDGDGWGDNSDAFPNDPDEWVDTDDDGTGDNADTDADGDGIDDTDEDSDGDGVNDNDDDFPFDANETSDSDGDGVGDNEDEFPDDASESTDTDGDGIGDNSDDDADGDGTPNDLDDFPLNSGESTDSDGDGVGDEEDAFPNDANEYMDTDNDGIGDNADTDDDGDGVPDENDAFPRDSSESSDADGDGYGDGVDVFPNDAGEWSDYDGDGVGDNSDAFMSDPYESRDSDGDGTGDNADVFPNDPNEKVDSDGDGVGNNADAFPTDASETKDTDGDGIGDNADPDADGDGIPDEPVDADEDGSSGLPGFTAITGLVSVLGAAILVAGRRKD